MSSEPTVNVFIKTLAEMLESQRERRTVRMRRQHKAQAERFLQTYRAGPDGELQPLSWTQERHQGESGLQGQTWAD